MAKKKVVEIAATPKPVVAPPAPIDIQARFRKANIYNSLLSTSLVEGDGPEEAVVENEIKSFIQERMEVLMGVRQDPTHEAQWVSLLDGIYDELKHVGTGGFSKEQAFALQRLAEKLLSPSTTIAAPTSTVSAAVVPTQVTGITTNAAYTPAPADFKPRKGYIPTGRAVQMMEEAIAKGEEVSEEVLNAVPVARGSKQVRPPPDAPQPHAKLSSRQEEEIAILQAEGMKDMANQQLGARISGLANNEDAVASPTEGITH